MKYLLPAAAVLCLSGCVQRTPPPQPTAIPAPTNTPKPVVMAPAPTADWKALVAPAPSNRAANAPVKVVKRSAVEVKSASPILLPTPGPTPSANQQSMDYIKNCIDTIDSSTSLRQLSKLWLELDQKSEALRDEIKGAAFATDHIKSIAAYDAALNNLKTAIQKKEAILEGTVSQEAGDKLVKEDLELAHQQASRATGLE